MLEMFDCKGPQKSLIATICSKAGSGVPKPLVTVLSMQLLQTLHCSVIMNPRFHNCPSQQTLMCNFSFICNAFLNAKLNSLCYKLKVFLFTVSLVNKEYT